MLLNRSVVTLYMALIYYIVYIFTITGTVSVQILRRMDHFMRMLLYTNSKIHLPIMIPFIEPINEGICAFLRCCHCPDDVIHEQYGGSHMLRDAMFEKLTMRLMPSDWLLTMASGSTKEVDSLRI